MKVPKMNDEAVAETIKEIFTSLLASDAEMQRTVLQELVDSVLDPLAAQDFFGTEGWEHWASLEN